MRIANHLLQPSFCCHFAINNDHVILTRILSAVLDLNGNSRAIRPRLTYAVNDHRRLTAGLDHFDGPSQSYFSALTKNNTAFVLLSWVF